MNNTKKYKIEVKDGGETYLLEGFIFADHSVDVYKATLNRKPVRIWNRRLGGKFCGERLDRWTKLAQAKLQEESN